MVEDEVLVRLMMADELRGRGFAVLEAANVEEALAVLESSARVDLVLTDVRMPGRLDGLALVQVLNEKRPRLKVILASAHRPNVDFPENVVAYVQKPYDVGRVIQVIRRALS